MYLPDNDDLELILVNIKVIQFITKTLSYLLLYSMCGVELNIFIPLYNM